MKIDVYMTLTMNGLIALPDGNVTWSKETWKAYAALTKQYKATIVGHTTYDLLAEDNEFRKIGDPIVIVFGKKKAKLAAKHHYQASTIAQAKTILKKLKISKVIHGGGAKALSAFIEDGVVDNVIIDIEPQLYGQGMNFINAKKPWVKHLKLLNVKTIAKKIVRITYKA
ncbi:MAG: dihydrofolate reductase family protein [Bdellovibrionales bacterium]